MKQYFKLIILLLISIPSYCFSQDPSCEFIISVENIDNIKYDYKLIIQYDYEKESIDSIEEKLNSRWEFDYSLPIESSILKSYSNNKILVGYISDYCYPNHNMENQLRIIIARREKEKKAVELMYTSSKLVPLRTEIIINNFQSGQRENEVFEYQKEYVNKKNVDYGHQQYLMLNSRKIYVK